MAKHTIKNLPLFPLKAVLFPGSLLPLHIFEERYKTLINECIESGSEFGINFVEGEKTDPIGCTASVKQVLKRYDDGRMDIVVEGNLRYTLKQLVENEAPYFVGEVSFFDDNQEEVNKSLRLQVVEMYEQFTDVVFNATAPSASTRESDERISFFLVQKSGLELKERQNFLSVRSENERLAVLKRHFEAMLPLIASRDKYERLVVNDGYLAPF